MEGKAMFTEDSVKGVMKELMPAIMSTAVLLTLSLGCSFNFSTYI
jgi:hypothetical protein